MESNYNLWDWKNSRPPSHPSPNHASVNNNITNSNSNNTTNTTSNSNSSAQLHRNYYQLPVHAVPSTPVSAISKTNIYSSAGLINGSYQPSPGSGTLGPGSSSGANSGGSNGSPSASNPPPLPPKPPKQYVQNSSPAVYEFRALPSEPIDRPLGPRANSRRSQYSQYSHSSSSYGGGAGAGGTPRPHSYYAQPYSPSPSDYPSNSYRYPTQQHTYYAGGPGYVDDNGQDIYEFDRDRLDYVPSASPSTDTYTARRTASTSNSSYTAHSAKSYGGGAGGAGGVAPDDDPWNLDRPVEMPSVPGRSDDDDDEDGDYDDDFDNDDLVAARNFTAPPLPPLPVPPAHSNYHHHHNQTTQGRPPSAYFSRPYTQSPPLPPRDNMARWPLPVPPSTSAKSDEYLSNMPQSPSVPAPPSPPPALNSPFHGTADAMMGSPTTISSVSTAIPTRSPGNIPSVAHAPAFPDTPPYMSGGAATSSSSTTTTIRPRSGSIQTRPRSGSSQIRPRSGSTMSPSPVHALPPLPNSSPSYSSGQSDLEPDSPLVSKMYQHQMFPTNSYSTNSLAHAFQSLPKRNSMPPPLNRARSSDVFAASSSTHKSSVSNSLMVQLGLPSLPKPVRTWAQLSSKDYDNCSEPWALSSIARWLVPLFEPDALIPFKDITQCLVGLFTHCIPTLNWVRTEQISQSVVNSFISCGFFLVDSASADKARFGSLDAVNGVLPTLTNKGCYTSCHNNDSTTKCYSCRCSRTIPVRPKLLTDSQMMAKVDSGATTEDTSGSHSTTTGPSSSTESSLNSSDWAAFWKISASHLSSLHKREVRRQYAIHELIMGEESFVTDLNILVSVYGQSLPSNIMRQQQQFVDGAFGSISKLIECNSTFLLRNLKLRQQQQGPFLEGIADIVLEWIKVAKDQYVAYSNSYVRTDRRLRSERDANPAFAAWLERAAKDPRAKGYPHSFYFHRAIPRLARYSLLLRTIQTATLESDPEHALLERCITECDATAAECNKRVADVENNMEILTLAEHIQFKGADQKADLKLTDPRRSIVHTGDILRRGEHRLDWVDTRLVLLDNFLLLTKNRKGVAGKFYVTKRPIPLDLLVLESCSDDAISKSSTKFGAGVFSTNTTSSSSSTQALHNMAQNNNDGDAPDLLYPFRVTHLGQAGATYTLYALSSNDRDKWREAIIAAKKRHYFTIHSIHAEPFRLRVLSDVAFGYEVPVKLPVYTAANAVDRALANRALSKTRPLAKSRITCGVSFVFVDGIEYWMLGLDYGVYVYDSRPGSIWRRCLDLPKVSQMAVLEDFNLLILVSDRALMYYHLDEIISSVTRGGPNACPVGYRLSQHRRVGFFTVGHLKTRVVLFYKRNDGLSSTFKVLEPIREKGSHRRRSKLTFARSMAFSSTEYFREDEKFSIGSEVYGLSLLKTTFAVHTSKGFEALSLDNKTPRTIPLMASLTSGAVLPLLRKSNISRPPTLEAFKRRIESCKPISMFRVSPELILLCYDDLAIYCDNNGVFCGPSVIWFLCRAKSVALQLPYLIAFDSEMIEIRKAVGGQLKQVISGKDIRAIDTRDGQIKIAMAHPKLQGRQLVMDMITNEFVVDDEASTLSGL